MIERQYRAQRARDRKRDARSKIQLGGLIVKAGLGHEDPAVLLGLLSEGFDALGHDETRARYRRRGKAIFDDDTKRLRADRDN